MSILEDLYVRMPCLVQRFLVALEGYRLQKRRYDQEFFKILSEIENFPYYGEKRLQEYHQQQLRSFLKTAAEPPFWNTRFVKYGVDIDADNPFQELAKLPILTKTEVKENIDQFRHRKRKWKLVNRHTSGTTGSGMRFWCTEEAEKRQWATWLRYRNWHGINKDTWCGYFGGRSIIPLSNKTPPYYRKNPAGKQLLFSVYHLNKDTIKDYVKGLVDNEISWLHGYPSALSLLASLILEQNIEPPLTIEHITTGSESLLPRQKRIIQKVFAAPVWDFYGQSEGTASISMCDQGKYHVDEDFAYVEFLPLDGFPGEYKVIGTNWTNPAFPLIRYDTGDRVSMSDKICDCGRNGRIVDSIDGRIEDYLILPNGNKIGRLDHIFKDLVSIKEAQLLQHSKDHVTIKIIKGKGYTNNCERQLLSEARKRIGNQIGIDVQYVQSIPRTKTGKLRFVVSTVRKS